MVLKPALMLILIGCLVGCNGDSSNKTPSPDVQTLQGGGGVAPPVDPNKAKREELRDELSFLNQNHSDLASRVSGVQDDISDLNTRLVAVENDMKTHDGQVASFVSDNLTPIACFGAADVALDEGNQYEQDAKDAAALVTVVCGVMLFDAAFRTQVIDVADALNQADIYSNNLVQQADTIRAELDEKSFAFETDKARLDKLDLKIQELQLELDELIFN